MKTGHSGTFIDVKFFTMGIKRKSIGAKIDRFQYSSKLCLLFPVLDFTLMETMVRFRLSQVFGSHPKASVSIIGYLEADTLTRIQVRELDFCKCWASHVGGSDGLSVLRPNGFRSITSGCFGLGSPNQVGGLIRTSR